MIWVLYQPLITGDLEKPWWGQFKSFFFTFPLSKIRHVVFFFFDDLEKVETQKKKSTYANELF